MSESAGILLYRLSPDGSLEVLLGHPGGPIWASRDEGSWSIPKGLVDPDEDLFEAALREFEEEVGLSVAGKPLPLGSIRLKSGKTVHAWAVEGDMDPSSLVSNTFDMEWPRGSGRNTTFPELDRVGWFTVEIASRKLNPAQVAFVERLTASLQSDGLGRVLGMAERIEKVAPDAVVDVRHRNLRAHTTAEEAAFDGDDHPLAGHFQVVTETGVVAVASVMPENRQDRADEWRIRGMATDVGFRGRGYGTALLEMAMQWATDHGAEVIWCNARIGAKSLYLRAGFQPVGKEFEPLDLGPHIQMERQRLEAQS